MLEAVAPRDPRGTALEAFDGDGVHLKGIGAPRGRRFPSLGDRRTVAPTSSMVRNLCSLVIAPPEIHSAPNCCAPPNADQKPMNGPNEKAKKTRSAAVTFAAR